MRFSGCLFTVLMLFVLCLPGRVSAAGPLFILQCLPEGEVDSLTQIVVRFSEPIRPLGIMKEQSDTAPVRLEAAEGTIPPGSWLWLDPSTLAYLLDEPVAEPARITAVIPKGATALSGATLGRESRFSVSTPPLALSATAEGAFDAKGNSVLPPQGGVIRLASNYRLDPQSIRASLAGASLAGASGPTGLGPVTEPDWQKDNEKTGLGHWSYSMPVTGAVLPGERFILRLEPGFTTARGVNLRRGFVTAVGAYGPLAVLSLRPEEPAPGKTVNPDNALTVQFSNAVRYDELLRHLRIEPAVARADEDAPGSGDADAAGRVAVAPDADVPDADAESRYFSVPCHWQPGVRYTVSLLKGLRDQYGLTLDRDVTRTFTVGDFTPAFFMRTGDMVLEKSAGGRFPLEIMNIDAVTARLFAIPWENGGYAAYAPGECDAGTLERLAAMPGVTSKTLSLDFSNRRNELVTHEIHIHEPDSAAESGIQAGPGVGSGPDNGAKTASVPGFIVLAAETHRGKAQRPVTFCARIQSTDLGLTMQRGMSDSLAFVTDLQSGAPLGGVALELVDASGGRLWQGMSDSNGLAFAPGLAELSRLAERSGPDTLSGPGALPGPDALPGHDTPPGGKTIFLTASHGDDRAVLPVLERDARWNQTDIHTPPAFAVGLPERLAAHALTQLPLYQPGQEVNYTLFIRRHVFADPQIAARKDVWLPVTEQPVMVEVLDSRQKVVHQLEAATNAYGSVSGGFTLPEDAAPGGYAFRTREAGPKDKDGGWIGAGSFKVAEFRPPEFRVDLTAPPSQVRASHQIPASVRIPASGQAPGKDEKRLEPLTVSARAGYFSGAPLPDGLVSLAVTPSDSRFKPERLNDYATGILEPFPFFHSPSRRDTAATPPPVMGRLDAEGNATLALPALAADPGQPVDVTLEATVTDTSGLTSQGNASFILHPSDYYIGIKGPRFTVAGAPFTLELKAASADNAPLSDVAVTLLAERLVPPRSGERYTDERHTDDERYETVWTKDLRLEKAEGERFSVSFDRGGLYRLQAGITDPSGNATISRLTVYVPGGPAAWFGPRGADALELAADADEYSPGETARIVIKNPYGKATALVTTERDGIRAARVLEVDGPAPEIAVPIFADDAPYMYVGVTLVRGRVDRQADDRAGSRASDPDSRTDNLSGDSQTDGIRTPGKRAVQPDGQQTKRPVGQQTILPNAARTVAIIDAEDDADRPMASHAALRLVVRHNAPELAIELKTDAAGYRPGGAVSATARVTRTAPGENPAPAKAQVTLLAVDERILRAAGEGTGEEGEGTTNYDPSLSFRPLYLHLVATSDLRAMLTGLSRFFNRQYTNRVYRTAAGGMMLAAPAAPMMAADAEFMARQKGGAADVPTRADFGPLAYWLAAGETDDDGQLSVSFTLPDTLTGYRIVAVAADTEGRFAKAETSVTASKPLQVLPALPRFLTVGDTLEARFLLQNLGPHDGEAIVELRLEGAAVHAEQAGRGPETPPPPPSAAGLTEAAKPTKATGAAPMPRTARVRVKAGGDAVATFPLTAHKTGVVTLTVSAALGQERDAAAFTLPALPAAPLTAVAASGMLKAGERFTLPVALPERLDPRSALDVTLAASPAAGMAPALRQLLDYPYECLEQRLSKAWARAVRLEHGAMLGLAPDPDDMERISETLKSVPSFQTHDGGFALWPGYENGDLYLTAYALLAADHMRPLGPALDPESESKAYAYLAHTLADALAQSLDPDNAGRHVERGFSGNGIETDAFALWALSRNEEYKTDAATLWPKAYDKALTLRHDAAPMLWCSLMLAMAELPDMTAPAAPDAVLQRLITELEKTAEITPTQMHFGAPPRAVYWMTMGSSLRDNGMALAALTAVKPAYPRLDALAFWLSQGLGAKEALSTQEAVFGFRGLALFLKQFSGDGVTAVEAVWDGNGAFSARFERLVDPPALHRVAPLNGGKETALTLTAQEGAPCWTARLVYARADSPAEAKNAGFTLTRRTAARDTTPIDKATDKLGTGPKNGPTSQPATGPASEAAGKPTGEATWRMGDEVTVALTLYVPASRRHVLLFDPFPAGLEPLYASRTDLADRNLRGQYPWQYQDMRKDGLMLYAPVINPGVYTFTYKLRAAFPGAFVHRPAQVEEMYTPEVMGRCAGQAVMVVE